jgi:bifunctional DNA primase/polymerase-like protein
MTVSETEVRPPAGPDSESNHHHATADNDSIGSGDQDQSYPPQGYGTGAPIYLEAGWLSPLPVPHGRKTPVPSGFTGHKGEIPTLDRFQQWIRDRSSDNLAIRMPSDVIGFDVDAYEGKKGAQTLAEGEKRYGRLPAGPSSSSRGFGPSRIRYFRVPPGTMFPGKIECLVDGEKTSDIEIIQRHHRYAVVWPSIHPEGRQYQWFDAEGNVIDGPPPSPGDLPELPAVWLLA